jgi:hypothetical protein
MNKSKELLEKFNDVLASFDDISESANMDKAEALRKALHKAKFFYKKHATAGSPFGTYTRNMDGIKHVIEMEKHPSGSIITMHHFDGKVKDDYPSTTHKRLKAMNVID